jgi:hypothetical protein
MSKEFEIGINLIKKVLPELEKLLEAQDKLTVRRILNTVFNPITASAYQIRVGHGPKREELLSILIPLVGQMRELSDLDVLKESIRRLIKTVKEVEEEVSTVQEQKNA